MALIDALRAWEDAWISIGVDTGAELLPGIPPEQVRDAIRFAPVHPDLETFYAWHNGSVSGLFVAPPVGMYLDKAEFAEDTRESSIAVTRLVLTPDEFAEDGYPEHWVPLLRGSGGSTINMDPYTGEIWRYAIDPMGSPEYSSARLRIADDLESLIPPLLDAIEHIRPSITVEQYYVGYDPRLLPQHLYDQGIVR